MAPSGMTVAEFKEQGMEENGLFKLTETTVDDDGIEHETVRYFRSPEGRLPLTLWLPMPAGAPAGPAGLLSCSTRRTP